MHTPTADGRWLLKEITTEKAPPPGGAYSQGIIAGPVLVTAGQVGIDPLTGELLSGVAAQVDQAIANLEAILSIQGRALTDVIKTTCFLARIEDFEVFDATYARKFGDHRPARSTMGVALAGDLLFEIEAWSIARTSI